MARQLPIDAAAAVLGVSRRTLERRIAAGQAVATYDNGRTFVAVPDEVIDASGTTADGPRPDTSDTPDTTRQPRHDSPAIDAIRVAYEAQLAALRSERDWLRQHVDHLTITNAQLTATVQRALPAPVAPVAPVAPEPPPAPEPAPSTPPQRPGLGPTGTAATGGIVPIARQQGRAHNGSSRRACLTMRINGAGHPHNPRQIHKNTGKSTSAGARPSPTLPPRGAARAGRWGLWGCLGHRRGALSPLLGLLTRSQAARILLLPRFGTAGQGAGPRHAQQDERSFQWRSSITTRIKSNGVAILSV